MKGFAEAMANLVSGFNSMLTLVMKQFSETMDKFSVIVQTKIDTLEYKIYETDRQSMKGTLLCILFHF